jgi:hypothetical protein
MDPLSIVAGVIAVVQAGERLSQLASKVSLFIKATEEIDSLIHELSDLKLVLNALRVATSNLPEDFTAGLGTILNACSRIILALDGILQEILSKAPESDASVVQTQMSRLRWLKRRDRVQGLMQRLRDAKSTLALQVLALNS